MRSFSPLRVILFALLALISLFFFFNHFVGSDELSQSGVIHVKQAQVSAYTAKEITLVGPTAYSTVSLPHSWNSERPQRFGVFQYIIEVTETQTNELLKLTSESEQRFIGLYIPRIGNRYEIFLNGNSLKKEGDLFDSQFAITHEAAFMKIPVKSLLNSAIKPVITIQIAGEARRYAGLSSLYIGPYKQLSNAYQRRTGLQNTADFIIVTISLLLGLIALLVFIVNRDRKILLYSLASFAWAFHNMYLTFNHGVLGYPFDLIFYDVFFVIGVTLLLNTLALYLKIKHTLFNLATLLFIPIAIVLIALFHFYAPIFRTFFLNGMLILCLWFFVLYLNLCFKHPKKINLFIFVVFSVSIGFAVYDQFIVYRHKNGFELFALSKFSYVLCSFSIALLVALRVRRFYGLIHRLRQHSRHQLSESKQMLVTRFSETMMHEKQQLLTHERSRIMQDLHDGLGHRLLSLKYAVNSASADTINGLINKAMADLRTTVLRLSKQHGDMNDMLSDLRENIEMILSYKKITLIWEVDHLSKSASFEPRVIETIEKMLLEIFNNIIKHSNASNVTLAAKANTHQFLIDITENGQGYFKPPTLDSDAQDTATGFGLTGLESRGRAIGALIQTQDLNRRVSIILDIPYALTLTSNQNNANT